MLFIYWTRKNQSFADSLKLICLAHCFDLEASCNVVARCLGLLSRDCFKQLTPMLKVIYLWGGGEVTALLSEKIIQTVTSKKPSKSISPTLLTFPPPLSKERENSPWVLLGAVASHLMRVLCLKIISSRRQGTNGVEAKQQTGKSLETLKWSSRAAPLSSLWPRPHNETRIVFSPTYVEVYRIWGWLTDFFPQSCFVQNKLGTMI